MVKSAEARQRDQLGAIRRLRVSGATEWRVFVEGVVGPVVVVVADVLSEDPAKVVFIEDDHVIETLSP